METKQILILTDGTAPPLSRPRARPRLATWATAALCIQPMLWYGSGCLDNSVGVRRRRAGGPVSPVCATTWPGSARSWSVSDAMLKSRACGELELRNRFRRGRHHVGLLWPVTGRRPLPIGKGRKGLDALGRPGQMTDGRPQQPTTKQRDNGLQSWGFLIILTLRSSAVARPSPLRAISRLGRVQRTDVAPCCLIKATEPPKLPPPP